MIAYYKLMDLLNRKGMPKGELQEKIGASSATIAKLSNNEYVALKVINDICKVLEVQPGDIMEYVPDEADPSGE